MICAKMIVASIIVVVIMTWIRFMIPVIKDLTEDDSSFLRFFNNFIMYIPLIALVLTLGLIIFTPNV